MEGHRAVVGVLLVKVLSFQNAGFQAGVSLADLSVSRVRRSVGLDLSGKWHWRDWYWRLGAVGRRYYAGTRIPLI